MKADKIHDAYRLKHTRAITYQILREVESTGTHQIINDGLGEVMEITDLQTALQTLSMFNENSRAGIKYKLRGIQAR